MRFRQKYKRSRNEKNKKNKKKKKYFSVYLKSGQISTLSFNLLKIFSWKFVKV